MTRDLEAIRVALVEEGVAGPDSGWCRSLRRVGSLLEAIADAVGRDDFSDGLDALAGTVRLRSIEDGRWGDLNGLYRDLVDIRSAMRTQ